VNWEGANHLFSQGAPAKSFSKRVTQKYLVIAVNLINKAIIPALKNIHQLIEMRYA